MEIKKEILKEVMHSMMSSENDFEFAKQNFYDQPYESWLELFKELNDTETPKLLLARMLKDLETLIIELNIETLFSETKSKVNAGLALIEIKHIKTRLELAIGRVLKVEPHELDLDKKGYNLPIMVQARTAYQILRLKTELMKLIEVYNYNKDLSPTQNAKKFMQELNNNYTKSIFEWGE